MIDYKNVPINTKMVYNTQTNFIQALVYKSLLCSHLEQNVINIDYVTSLMIEVYECISSWTRQMHNNEFYRSVCLKVVFTSGTIFLFMVTNRHILNSTNRYIDG